MGEILTVSIDLFTGDTDDIVIPSSFISRASFLIVRDLHRDMENEGRSHGLDIEILPDEGYEWYAHDLFRLCAIHADDSI